MAVPHTDSHLKGQLCSEGQLVSLKQAPADVVEGGVGDTVDQGVDSDLHVLKGVCHLHSFVKNHVEGLWKVRMVLKSEQ